MKFLLRTVYILLILTGANLFAHSGGEPPEVIVRAATELLPHLESEFAKLKSGDFLVLDLDNTVFREVQMLGTDEWYSAALHQRMSSGESRADATRALEKDNVRIKVSTRARLMEEGIKDLIFKLQTRGVFVVGLTARHPRLASVTHIRLRQLGVEFSRGPELRLARGNHPPLGDKHAFLWSGNVAFTDGSPKGLILRHLIGESGSRPRRVMAIDDRIYHVHTFVEALLDLKVAGRVIHYLRYQEEEPFDAALAEIQLREFRESGRILSDSEARRLCEVRLTSASQTN